MIKIFENKGQALVEANRLNAKQHLLRIYVNKLSISLQEKSIEELTKLLEDSRTKEEV